MYTAKPATAANAPDTTVLPAAPVNCAGEPVMVPVALPLPEPPMPPDCAGGPYPGMVTMEGLVAFLPASHEGTGALERVTMTSGAGPVGQPALAVMVVVTEPAGAEGAGEAPDTA